MLQLAVRLTAYMGARLWAVVEINQLIANFTDVCTQHTMHIQRYSDSVAATAAEGGDFESLL